MKTIRIFISSPGDVETERERAKQVVEVLHRRYAGRLRLKAILWEDLPLGAHGSFQEGIDDTLKTGSSFEKGVQFLTQNDGGIDIAIFILWSRLGSPLGTNILKSDGSTYRSGTEREFDLMLRAHAESEDGRPQILFYRRVDEVSFEARLRGKSDDEKQVLINQKKSAENFMKEEFHDSETDTNVRAFHTFSEPVGFSKRLRVNLQNLLDNLAGDEFGEVVWDTTIKGSPFRGIEPFEFEHAPLFFGREDEQLEVRRALREQADSGCAFVVIWGASGSGKSSLARAGVLPEVAEYEIDDSISKWLRVVFTPAELGQNLFLGFVNLLASTKGISENAAISDSLSRESLARLMRENPMDACQATLFPIIRECAPEGKTRLIILIDQMEEFFTSTDTPEDVREPFFRMLQILAQSGLVWILCTMRSDFYSVGQSSPALRGMRGRKGDIDLTAPGPEAIRRMVEEPVRLSDLNWEYFESRPLSNKILEDIHGEGEFLPLLEYLLEALYNQKDEEKRLCYDIYEKLGGVHGALNDRAEEIFNSLSHEAQLSFGGVMQKIAAVDTEDGKGFVRRWADQNELWEDPHSREFIQAFLSKGNRLFVTKNSDHDGSTTVISVAHEALLTAWKRLANWLRQHRTLLKARTAVSEDARRWKELDLNPDYLYPAGAQLEEAKQLMNDGALERNERNFVRESAASASRKALKQALKDGTDLEAVSFQTRQDFPEVWHSTMAHCLSEGTEAQRRNAAAVLVHSSPSTLNCEILKRLEDEHDHSIRYELARTLVRRNDQEAFEALAEKNRSHEKYERSDARESLGILLAAAHMEKARPGFVDWFKQLSIKERRRIWLKCFFVRFKRSLPVFLFVLIPTMIFAVVGAALVKWLPSSFNYSCVQSTAGFAIGLFHSAPAGMVVGGGVVAGLTFYRMVIGKEYTPLGYLRPYGAIFTGVIAGALAGVTCVFLILGVYDPMTLSGLGWIQETTTKPPFRHLMRQVFHENLCGYVFPLTSIGTGLGLSIMTNRLRNSKVWHSFISQQNALRSIDQLISTVGGLFRITWRYAWTIPLFVGLGAVVGFGLVSSGAHITELEDKSFESIFLGGIEQRTSDEELGNLHFEAQENAMEKRMNWKRSKEGTALGIFGDSLAKIVGSYFSIIGMGLGIVIMRHGVFIEPKRA